MAEPDATITSLSLSFNGTAISGAIQYSGTDTQQALDNEDYEDASGVTIDGNFTDSGMIPEAHVVTFNWATAARRPR